MKYRLFVLTILASVGFFNPYQVFSPQLQKFMFYFMVMICTLYTFKDGISTHALKYPRYTYIVLLGGIFFSIFMATAFHQQGLKVSFITTLPYLLAYWFFFVLLKLDLPRAKIMNTYMVLCAIAIFIYFSNVISMPYNIYGEPVLGDDNTRGVIRIPIVFIEFFPMVIFYAINRWFVDRNKWWFVVMGIGLVMIVLSVIRQIIALTVILGLFFLFRTVSWRMKALMGATVVAIVVWVLPMIPIYNAMLELSEEQKEENDDTENIRITAWRYYTYEEQTNGMTPFFGNGVPAFEQSIWGRMVDTETDELGVFAVDVGWAGFFWYFGAITTGALLILLLKALFKKKPFGMQFTNYWLVFLILTSIASGPILFYYQIVDVVICLYLVYKREDETDIMFYQAPSEKEKETHEEDSTHNPELQQRRRYPQLRRLGAKA